MDATRIKDSCNPEPFDTKTDFARMDPLSHLQVSFSRPSMLMFNACSNVCCIMASNSNLLDFDSRK